MNALELRRRTLGKGVYKKTVEGNPAIAQGSLARRYPGITMQGWTEQAQYEGKNLLDASQILNLDNGINTPEEYTVSGNTIIARRVDGTGNQMAINIEATLEAGSYYCSYDGGEITTKAGETYQLTTFIQSWIKEKSSGNNLTPSGGVNVPNTYGIFTIDQESDVYWDFSVMYEWDSLTEVKIYGLRIVREVNTPWEPYTGGQPSPSPDYPQEIVSAGKYDEGTQKWEYEIAIANEQTDPDKNQTVTLTADRQLTKWDRLEKRNGVWGWVYKSDEIVLDGSEDWEIYPYYGNSFIINDPTFEKRYESSFCDKYRNVNAVWTKEGIYNAYSDHPNNARKYFKPPSAEVQTVEQWKTWLSENPLTLWYETAEETFVPLSESEQEQMNALHTFRPTTVLSNDCNCNMTLTYKTKKSLEVTD